MVKLLSKYIFPIVIVCAFFCSETNALSQTSSMVYSEDTTQIIESEYDRLYRLFLSDKKRIYTIIKINATDWGQLMPSIVVEQNMNHSYNFEVGMRLSAFDWSFENGINYAFTSTLDFKYYYNYKRREKRGRKTNGFSGNYFALGGALTVSDYNTFMETEMLKHNIHFASPLNPKIYNIWSADLKYGIQRRLGAIGYIDVQAGFRYINYINYGENLLPILRVGIGFGLTKEKALSFIK